LHTIVAALGSSEITYLVDDGGPLLPTVNEGPLVRARVEKRVVTDPTEGHPAPQPPIHSRTSQIRKAPSWTLTSGTVPRSRSR
jgi:hypothetical protein